MATLARPPLQHGPQPKRPIAPAEQSARARWLLDPLPPPGRALTDSAPRRKARLSVDSYTNLLTTTLAVQSPYALPLSAGRQTESAPPREKWIGDPESSQGFIVYDGPNGSVVANTDSAPPRKKAAYAWDYPNLTVTTLAPLTPLALPLNAGRAIESAPRRKLVIYELSLSRPLTLGINPNANPVALTDSAPQRERVSYSWEYPNLSATTLAPIGGVIPLPLSAARADNSALPAKRNAQVESIQNLTLALTGQIPIGQFTNQSAPALHYQAKIDSYPNLTATTLAIPPILVGMVNNRIVIMRGSDKTVILH